MYPPQTSHLNGVSDVPSIDELGLPWFLCLPWLPWLFMGLMMALEDLIKVFVAVLY